MKLLLVSDVHFGARKNSEIFLDIMKKYFLENISNQITDSKIDQLWILGDLFDNRVATNVLVKNTVFDILVTLLENHSELLIKIVTGNHDIYFKNTLQTSSLKPLKYINDRIELIDSVKEYNIGNKSVIVYPWLCDGSKEYEIFSKNSEDSKNYDYCFGHFEINGFEVSRGSEHTGGPVSVSDFKNYTNVFSGHFHLRNKKSNIQYLGCPYELCWSDYGDDKGMTIIDTTNDEILFIQNNTSPKHIQLRVSLLKKNPNEIQKAKNSWVKFFIDEAITDEERNTYQTKIESLSPLNFQVIDETIGEIDNEEVELDSDLEGDELTFMNEYIEQTVTEQTVDMKSYAKTLYDRALS